MGRSVLHEPHPVVPLPGKKLQRFRFETTAEKLQGFPEKANAPVLPSFLDFKDYV